MPAHPLAQLYESDVTSPPYLLTHRAKQASTSQPVGEGGDGAGDGAGEGDGEGDGEGEEDIKHGFGDTLSYVPYAL